MSSGKQPGTSVLLGTGRFRCVRKALVSAAFSLAPALAFALDPATVPTGGTVAAGAASISQAGPRLTVQQQSNRAILNWNTFNIGAGASVNFQQPASTSVVLNRVAGGGGVSEIYGSLTANGQVFLVNPAGTLFARGAQVNVGGLVASSLDITNENFMNGIHRFAANGTAGSILNQGTLTAADGGYIALLAPQVRNEGVVAARMGTVAFGAGEAVRLDINGTGLVEMQVEQAAVDALIANRSLVQADGGIVLMGTRAAGQLAAGVVNNSGEIRAARVTERDGVIRLEAGDVANSGSIAAEGADGGRITLASGNTTINSGSISARGSAGKGGEVRLLGDKVGLFGSARVDASGELGGGTVLLGGNYQGKGPEQNASRTVVDADAQVDASATGNGDGGKVIVWANDFTRFSGSIEAKGGPQGGNGGFVETSAKNVLRAFGKVDASAPKGIGGTWLLDPNNITISSGTDANTTGTFDSIDDGAILNNVTLGNALTNGTTVNVTTQSAGTNGEAGDIFVQAGVTANLTTGQTATLNLNAQRNIDFSGGGSLSGGTGNLNVNLNAGTDVGFTNMPGTLPSAITMVMGSTISTGNGNLTATANTNGITLAGIFIGSGSLTVESRGGPITQASPVQVGGSASFDAGANTIALTNALNDFTGAVSLSNTGANAVQITVANSLALGTLNIASGNLTVASTGAVNLGSGSVGGNLDVNTNSSGAITQTGGLSIGGTTTLTASGNAITLNNPGNDFTGSVSASGSSLALADANSLSVSLSTTGAATISAGGSLTVSGMTGGALSTTTTSGGTTNLGFLDVASANVVSSGSIAINDTLGAISGGVSLTSTGGGITEFSLGRVNTTGALTTSSATGQVLTGANTVGTFNASNFGNGGIAFTNTASPLIVSGINSTGVGNVSVSNAGAISLAGVVNAIGAGSTVSLTSSGTISESGAGLVNAAGTLTTSSVGGQTLNSGNSVGGFIATNTTSGNISFKNIAGGPNTAPTVAGVTSLALGAITSAGGVDITNDGSLLVNSVISTGTGSSVSLTTTGASGDLVLNSFLSNVTGFTANASRDILRNAGITSATGTLNATAGRDIRIVASGAAASLSAAAMNLAAGGELLVQAGSGTNAFAEARATGAQTVNANKISLLGGPAGIGNSANLQGGTIQTIVVGSGGLNMAAGGGADNAAFVLQTAAGAGTGQTIAVNGGGSIVLKGGSSGAANVGSGHGARALIQASGVSQQIDFSSGGAIDLTGGTVGSRNFAQIYSANGSQSITGAPAISLTGGASGGIAGEGNYAEISSFGAQSVSAAGVSLKGGSGGISNYANLFAGASQVLAVTGTGALTLLGGSGGGAEGTDAVNSAGNFAQLRANGNQDISVGAGGISVTGGSGSGADNFAQIRQGVVSLASAATPGTRQTITVNNGGRIALQGGSTTTLPTAAGNGSYGRIRGEGDAQTINFTGGGSISVTGGTQGARNFAEIRAGSGTQTISGSPSIVLTGGASGGVAGDGNYAGIYTGSLAQTITSGDMTLNAGAGGINNSAFVQAAVQNIAVHGNLALIGGGSANGPINGGGAGIGGRGGSSPTATNLQLAVDGNITLTGGSVSGVDIGSGFAGGQATDMTITAGGNVTLNPGTGAGARLGTPAANPAGGNISVTAGGAIALNDSATVGSAIRTAGNVTLKAASISEGTNGLSLIGASALTTTSTTGATALNSMSVGSLNATSGGALNLGQGTIGGTLVATSSAGPITQAGPLLVAGTSSITAGAAPITLTSANDFTGTVLLGNSGPNAVQVSDINTITFTNMVLGGSLTVNAPTIIAHDTTTTGNQVWNGSVTFNSTETTNGGSFTVTGNTTLGNGLTVNAGSGNVTFQGAVNGTQTLVVNSSGFTNFVGTVSPTVSLSISGASNAPTTTTQAVTSVVASTVSSLATDVVSASPLSGSTSASTSTTSAGAAAATIAAAGGPPPAPLTAATSTEAGTTRLTASSGVSKETIRQVDQQIQQARTQMFSGALTQLAQDPSVADVPECGTGGGSVCVKQGKRKKSASLAAGAEPVIKRRLAVLFGNDRYLAPIPALQTPVHDVEEIGKVLQDKLGYETRIVKNATKEAIVNELNDLVTGVDEDDSVLVYYAGHGYQADKGGGGYWIPVDANNSDASSWISNSAISKFLANMASRQVMLVSDSCYSGTLAQEQKVSASESTVFDRKEILRKRSVLVMSSGGNEPVSDGGHEDHSLFAYHLLRNLKSIDADLVGSDIHARVHAAVTKEYPQDPQYGAVVSAGHAEGGEYLIMKK